VNKYPGALKGNAQSFFKARVGEIMKNTQSTLDLTSKELCFRLLGLCYKILPVSDLHAENGIIVNEYCLSSKKEVGSKRLTPDLLGICFNSLKNGNLSINEEKYDDKLLLNQVIFTTMMECFLATQSVDNASIFQFRYRGLPLIFK
jgi:hypothetical protein